MEDVDIENMMQGLEKSFTRGNRRTSLQATSDAVNDPNAARRHSRTVTRDDDVEKHAFKLQSQASTSASTCSALVSNNPDRLTLVEEHGANLKVRCILTICND